MLSVKLMQNTTLQQQLDNAHAEGKQLYALRTGKRALRVFAANADNTCVAYAIHGRWHDVEEECITLIARFARS